MPGQTRPGRLGFLYVTEPLATDLLSLLTFLALQLYRCPLAFPLARIDPPALGSKAVAVSFFAS